jgi:hypothetical protein
MVTAEGKTRLEAPVLCHDHTLCCTTKYIVIITSEPKQCTHIAHLHKSSILVSLMPESAELAWHHLEQVAITPMVDFS